MAATDHTSSDFNQDLIESMITEVIAEVNSAKVQFTILRNQLTEIGTRLRRAKCNHCLSQQYSLELQRDSLEGVICMYKRYLHHKVAKMNRLSEKLHQQQ